MQRLRPLRQAVDRLGSRRRGFFLFPRNAAVSDATAGCGNGAARGRSISRLAGNSSPPDAILEIKQLRRALPADRPVDELAGPKLRKAGEDFLVSVDVKIQDEVEDVAHVIAGQARRVAALDGALRTVKGVAGAIQTAPAALAEERPGRGRAVPRASCLRPPRLRNGRESPAERANSGETLFFRSVRSMPVFPDHLSSATYANDGSANCGPSAQSGVKSKPRAVLPLWKRLDLTVRIGFSVRAPAARGGFHSPDLATCR